jgi:hypothetical protein
LAIRKYERKRKFSILLWFLATCWNIGLNLTIILSILGNSENTKKKFHLVEFWPKAKARAELDAMACLLAPLISLTCELTYLAVRVRVTYVYRDSKCVL